MRISELIRVSGHCDVTCNGAWRVAISVLLMLAAVILHGCCDDPEPQINWEPDLTDFRKKAEWFDDKGVWRGNPTWKFSKELEVEDYHCKLHLNAANRERICLVWTVHEWNCNEHDFGVCKCIKLSEPHSGNYCEEWGCHALEADQEICRPGKNDGKNANDASEHCEHEEFLMDEGRYNFLVSRADAGIQTTGERYMWWSTDFWFPNSRRLVEDANQSDLHEDGSANLKREHISDSEVASDARVLQARQQWPPPYAYSPSGRHRHFRWNDVCIVNGDNRGLARRQGCHRWREIETEISVCTCHRGEKNACLRWTCEERDVGLFSVLFRTREDIKPNTEGTETEEYECKSMNADGYCVAWEGYITSREEVEWTRCECQGSGACSIAGSTWLCDEYEYPKTLRWNHPQYEHRYIWFIAAEIIGVCIFFRVCGEGAEDAIPVGLCFSCCIGIIIFPFLIVTYGFYAFLFLGLPFWGIRVLFCIGMFTPTVCGAVLEGIEELTGSDDKPVKKSSKERFKRGATKIIGKKTNNQKAVAPSPAEETNETNETNEVIVVVPVAP